MAEQIAAGRIVFPEDISKRPMVKRYKKNLKSEVNPLSTWIRSTSDNHQDTCERLQSGLNAEGTRQINDLFGATVFNYSKPVSLIRSLIEQTADDGEIILDFFAGSGTTAQAMLELDHEDHGRRKFILIQFPEPTGMAEYPSIAHIARERVRRVISGLNTADKDQLSMAPVADLGFRAFKLTTSNYRPWTGIENSDGCEYANTMEMFKDPLVPGWLADDVIWEVAIKEG